MAEPGGYLPTPLGIYESWQNLSDPCLPLAGTVHMQAPSHCQNCGDEHVATWAEYEKWCVGDAGRCPHPSCPGISLVS